MKMIKAILLITCLSTCTRSLNPSDNSNKNNHMSDINVCKSIRIPAEWEPHEATWMQWPGKYEKMYREEFAELIGVLQKYEPIVIVYSYPELKQNAIDVLTQKGISLTNIRFEKISNDNAWMRDNGPVYAVGCGAQRIQDWKFNAWGEMKWGRVSLPYRKDNLVPRKVASLLNMSVDTIDDYILERGNLESNGIGTVIVNWDCQKKRQEGWTKSRTEDLFKRKFGVDRVVWAPTSLPEEFTGGHIDGMARFINKNTVVVPKYVDQSHPGATVYEDAAAAILKEGLNVIRMDMPGYFYFDPKIPGDPGIQLEANYVNWLVGNGVVIATGFGVPEWDSAARATIEGYFPDRDVHLITAPIIWYYGGGVHCVTNDQPALSIRN
jgi:agmatine deiminase